jgi:nicotinamide-nucleotide amidase
LSRPTAVVVVTGSELVRGDRNDLNGPFLARELVARGLEPERIIVVGDAPEELEAALREGAAADLCVVSGGLGPTHDDRTVELVARVAGRGLRHDPELHGEIEGVSRGIAERLRRPYAEFEPGVRKQATLPEGAVSLGLAGTAPGSVLDTGSCVFVVLPGPPRELQRLWGRAVEAEAVRRVLSHVQAPEHRVLRFYGASESEVARALADAGGEGDGVTATICARGFEIHVDLFAAPEAAEHVAELRSGLGERLERYLFAEDERPVAELVLELCRERGYTLATAESCTGGLVAARLTEVPGASAVFRGSVVAYANDVKTKALGVPDDVLEQHGAVSAETAAAMASGVRARLGTDVGISVTGVAGPAGGTADKPVGLVYFHVATPAGEAGADFSIPADRATIRSRGAVASLHLARRVLSQSRDGRV